MNINAKGVVPEGTLWYFNAWQPIILVIWFDIGLRRRCIFVSSVIHICLVVYLM